MNRPPEKFGTVLGASFGVTGYSNGRCSFVASAATERSSGLPWQCVEYARRWYIARRAITFGPVATAADMWAKPPPFRRIEGGTLLPTHALDNGGQQCPELGDLLIYRAENSENLWAGHVAVVVDVDLANAQIAVAEQNFENKPWDEPNSYARMIPLSSGQNRYVVNDPLGSIAGWLRTQA